MTRFAIGVVVVSLGLIVFQGMMSRPSPADAAFLAADRAFADGNYDRALKNYLESLAENPDRIDAIRGQARTLLQLGRPYEAIEYFDQAIQQDPEFPGTYANRGIAYDRMGEHELALRDYDHALRLDPSIGDGPGWMTKLLHMNEPPPTVSDRADYLRAQLTLPEKERLLSMPEADKAQRTYRKR